MAMPSVSGTLGGGSGVWAQLQQRQAERAAEQAEQKARALGVQAREAQVDADRATEKARSLGVQSEQANGDAQEAKRGLLALDALQEVQGSIDGLRQQIGEILQRPVGTVSADSTRTAADRIGSLIDVSA